MNALYFNPAASERAPVHAHAYRRCEGQCGEMRPPERGVEIGRRWHCASCAAPLLRRMR
jgi:hypothetical protein